MDIVYIRDLHIDAIIGVNDWERKVRQTISLDLEMATDIRRAAETDDIQHTLNYKFVAKRLIQFVEDSDFQLIETMAERVAKIVREEFGVSWVKLRLSKLGSLRQSGDAGLMIERGTKPNLQDLP
jgi:dihydroneopterin aldolase